MSSSDTVKREIIIPTQKVFVVFIIKRGKAKRIKIELVPLQKIEINGKTLLTLNLDSISL